MAWPSAVAMRGISRFAIQLPRPAAGEDGALGPDDVDLPADQCQDAPAFALVGNQVDREAVLGNADRFAFADDADQGLGEFLASGVAEGMEDAGEGMAAFAREGQAMGIAGLLIEIRPPFQ